MGYEAKVICDSVSPAGVRLTTIEATFPRFILAEVNTHRMLSRSSASSRAIPVEKRIRMVKEDPFVPEAFGRNQKGMQSNEVLEGAEEAAAREAWEYGRTVEIDCANRLAAAGVHKQYANRRLEVDSFHTAVISATEWGNVDALRAHPAAQPEFQKIWRMVIAAREASTPQRIALGGWHLPYVRGLDEGELRSEGFDDYKLARISCARAGRVSYLTQDGRRDPQEDLGLFDRFLDAFHMSPLEHAATPYNPNDDAHVKVAMAPFFPRLRGGVAQPFVDQHDVPEIFIGNFRAWVQQRKLIPNEHDFSLRRGA